MILQNEHQAGLVLLCRIRRSLVAFPVACLVETMRPLPIEALAGAPAFVKGVCVIRGAPVPVVDAGLLLSEGASVAMRFVTLRLAGRPIALAVDEVIGIRPLAAESMRNLPALLQDAGTDVIGAIGSFDAGLLSALRGARIVSDAVRTDADSQAAAR